MRPPVTGTSVLRLLPPLVIDDAGIDRVVISGSLVQLDGTKSFDIDGDSLSFRWVAPEAIKLFNPFSSRPSFLAPVVLDSTEFIFSLYVLMEVVMYLRIMFW